MLFEPFLDAANFLILIVKIRRKGRGRLREGGHSATGGVGKIGPGASWRRCWALILAALRSINAILERFRAFILTALKSINAILERFRALILAALRSKNAILGGLEKSKSLSWDDEPSELAGG